MQIFRVSLPHAAAGRWCRLSLCMEVAGPWWAKLEATDSARGQVVREAFFGPRRRVFFGRFVGRTLVVHVPPAAGFVQVSVFSAGEASPSAPLMRLRVLSRAEAALRLLGSGWHLLPLALRGSARGVLGRIRAIIGQHAARRGEAPPYALWRDLFDRWGEAEFFALSAAEPLSIEVVIAGAGGRDDTAATLASVARQWRAPKAGARVIQETSGWALCLGDWVVVLRSGDVLAPHALACFAHAARRSPGKAAFCADFDILGAGGERTDPCLRPPPDPWSLASPYFGEGPWMFNYAACADLWAELPADAAQARLILARSLRHSDIEQVKLLLAHCPRRSPPRSADEIRRRRPREKCSAQAAPRETRISSGLRSSPMVSIIVPSACRSAHVLDCLKHVLRATDYPDFEILLAISRVDSADVVQAKNLHRAGSLPRVRVIDLAMPVFNFAAVNNKAACFANGSLLLLLNDDVVPISADWLTKLVAYVCKTGGEQADIVGPRLLYGNGLVQHGGVIMGLANLCEHAFRLTSRGDRGPHGVAALDRQLCAVTAACMLVRRSLFESLGGLDEGFAIALNDVDFCLRASALGGRVVFAAGVELYHFESLSLGRHYEGARAGLEAMEVRRLRARWETAISTDPFYHPCACLEVGREFQPGFPPRQSPLSWIACEPLALD